MGITKDNKQKRTIVGLVTAIICLLIFSATMTFAFFTANNSASSSSMQFGTLAVGINGYTASNADLHTLVPGCTISLDGNIELAERENNAESGTITSNSTIGAFVRIKLTLEPATSGDTLPDTTGLMSTIQTAFGSSWLTSGSDGYLYYAGKFMPVGTSNLGTNEVTGFNLSTVSFVINKESFGNAWQGKSFKLKIEVEAIQAEHVGVTAAQITTGGQTLADAIAGAKATGETDSAWSGIGGNNGGEQNNSLVPDITNMTFTEINEDGSSMDNAETFSSNIVNEMKSLNDATTTDSVLMSGGNGKYAEVTGCGGTSAIIPAYVKIVNNETQVANASEWPAENVFKVIQTGYGMLSGDYDVVSFPETLKYIYHNWWEYTCDTLYYYPTELISEYVGLRSFTHLIIGSNVQSLPCGIFAGGSYGEHDDSNELLSVMFEQNSHLQSIGEYAFKNSQRLTSIELPNSLTAIGVGAFDYCGLTSVVVPENVTPLYVEYNGYEYLSWIFGGCWKLVHVCDMSGLFEIGTYWYRQDVECVGPNEAFTNTLEVVNNKYVVYTVGQEKSIIGVTDIAITNTDDLGDAIGVARIDNFAFWGCNDLISICIPSNITNIGYYSFYSAGYYADIEGKLVNLTAVYIHSQNGLSLSDLFENIYQYVDEFEEVTSDISGYAKYVHINQD